MAFWEHLTAMLARTPIGSRKCGKRGQKPGKLRASRRATSRFSDAKEKKNSLKMNELSWNVYENKGPAFDTRGRSGNVVENKGGYASKAGMSLKTRLLSPIQFREDFFVCSLVGRASPRRSLGPSVCSVLKLESHRGRGESCFGCGQQPRCDHREVSCKDVTF